MSRLTKDEMAEVMEGIKDSLDGSKHAIRYGVDCGLMREMARMSRHYYLALKAEGFRPEQAILIVAGAQKAGK